MEFGVTLVGVGSVGSFVALTLAKMGVIKMMVYDQDRVTAHNIPNQFYTLMDINNYKVNALHGIIERFAGIRIDLAAQTYIAQPLDHIVIVATDNMASRRAIWEQFKQQQTCRYFIEARMGGQLGMLYTIRKIIKNRKLALREDDITFYESNLYPDEKVKPLPCTARTIIYNVLMIASLVGKSVATIANNKPVPREQIFDMEHIHGSSFMIRE